MAEKRSKQRQQQKEKETSLCRTRSELSLIISRLQQVDEDSTIQSEYHGNITHIFKCEKSLNLLLLAEQNLPYPDGCTDILVRCSNGIIRTHSLIMLQSTLIVGAVKDREEEERYLDYVEAQRAIGMNDFKVEHVAKLIFLFYTGTVLITLDEKRVIFRLLAKFGLSEDLFELALPVKYTDVYRASMTAQMQDYRLRIGLTTTEQNGKQNTDEYFIRPNGILEPVTRNCNGDEPDIIEFGIDPSIGFYCPECKFTYSDGTLDDHITQNHRSRNQPRKDSVDFPREIITEDWRTEQWRNCQPGTSSAARAPSGPAATSTPSRASKARSHRQQFDEPITHVYCKICFLVKDSDGDMDIHLQYCHPSHVQTKDINGPSLSAQLRIADKKLADCGVCKHSYLKIAGLENHMQEEHGMIPLKHYQINSSIPKCLVCNKCPKDIVDDASLFLEHVRKCMEQSEAKTLAAPKTNVQKKSSVAIPAKKSLAKNKEPKWYKNTDATIVDVSAVVPVVPKPSSKRTYTPTSQKAPQQKKKKILASPPKQSEAIVAHQKKNTVETPKNSTAAIFLPPKNRNTVENSLKEAEINESTSTTLVRVLRTRTLLCKMPQKKTVTKIPIPISPPQAHSTKGKVPPRRTLGKPKTGVTKPALKEKMPTKKVTVAANAVAAKSKTRKQVQKNENYSDDSDIIVPNKENVNDGHMGNEGDPESNKENSPIDKDAPSISGVDHSKSGSVVTSQSVPKTPQMHSTGLSNKTDGIQPGTSKSDKVPVIRIAKAQASSVTKVMEWVCSVSEPDETILTEVTEEPVPLAPESHRSCADSVYMTPLQSLECVSPISLRSMDDEDQIEDMISNNERVRFVGFSDSTLQKLSALSSKYDKAIQEKQYSLLIDDTELPIVIEKVWSLDFPEGVINLFK